MKQVDEIPGRRSDYARYDYDALFDGNVWCLERGEDFEVKPNNVGVGIRAAAKRRGIKVTVAVRGDKVFVQAEADDE